MSDATVTSTLLADGAVLMRAKKRNIADLYGAAKRHSGKPLPLRALTR